MLNSACAHFSMQIFHYSTGPIHFRITCETLFLSKRKLSQNKQKAYNLLNLHAGDVDFNLNSRCNCIISCNVIETKC